VCDDTDDDADDDAVDEDDVAALETSLSRPLDDDFATVDVAEDPDDPEDVAAAVEVVPGAWAANQAARARNDAALTAPVRRRARRAGWGFGVLMERSCAPPRKTT
jgi:hypothetical protein